MEAKWSTLPNLSQPGSYLHSIEHRKRYMPETPGPCTLQSKLLELEAYRIDHKVAVTNNERSVFPISEEEENEELLNQLDLQTTY